MFFRLRIIVGRGVEFQVTINIIFSTILVIALFLMGLEIDIRVIWNVLKKPIGPAIGFVSQFIFMPLCAYGLAKALLLNGKNLSTFDQLYYLYINRFFKVRDFEILTYIFSYSR